ncbi:MAG: diguanylate cyclase [Pseudomonadota bacterium]
MKDIVDTDSGSFFANLVANFCADSILITDAEGLTEWAYPAFVAMTGFTLEDMQGKKPGTVLQGKGTDPDTVAAIGRAIRARQPFRGEILNFTRDGEPYWIDMNIKPVFDASGHHTHFISVERDITDRKALEKRAEDALGLESHRQEERKMISLTSEWLYSSKSISELAQVVERSMGTIFPETEGQLYIYSNSRDTLDILCAWGGGEAPAHIDPNECWALRRGRAYSYGNSAIEFPCEHVQGDAPPYTCIPIIASGDTIGLMHIRFPLVSVENEARTSLDEYLESRRELCLLCAEQISLAIANVQLRQELEDQSTRDPLTNLWNRRWFLDTARKEFARAKQAETPVSIISIDVDHFKKFNDHHGHDAGDMVLREIGRLMISEFAETGHACRIGGEEFVVLLPEIDAKEAVTLANKYREVVADTELTYAGQKLPRLTISAGVADFPASGPDVTVVMKVADQMLYDAKDGGRNQVIGAKVKKTRA